VIVSLVRGLPVRDVEAALSEALGDQAAVSKSTLLAICHVAGDLPADQERVPDPGRQLLWHSPGLAGQAGAGA
jgi:hypothetical protein